MIHIRSLANASRRQWMIRSAALFALGSMPAGAGPAEAQELRPSQIAARSSPAVVRVVALANGREIGAGSGFLVSADGLVVTNAHVIRGAQTLRVELPNGEQHDRVDFVAADEQRDLILLRIRVRGASYLLIGDERSAEVGDPVYVLGNPMGLEGTFSDGVVSAKRSVNGVALLQVTAPISPGSSGGPVLNGRGEAIGVATLTIEAGQNLNIAVPARYARGLLAIGEEPVPFETVASRFPAEDGARADRPASNAADDWPAWMRVLVAEFRTVDAAARRDGHLAMGDPVADLLAKGETHTIEYPFLRAGERIRIVAVCDVDCSDVDLFVTDQSGKTVGRDMALDDRPQVGFTVMQPGTYRVKVYMAACANEPCAFAVRAYRRR